MSRPMLPASGEVTEWLTVAEIALAHHVPVVPHHADMMRVHRHLELGPQHHR